MTCRDEIYSRLSQLAIAKLADIVNGTKIVEGKLRIIPKDAIGDLRCPYRAYIFP
jgi:hypothetical protein